MPFTNSSFSSLLSPNQLVIQTLTQFIDGQIDQYANNLFANASHIQVGNSSVFTYISPNSVYSQSFTSGDTVSNLVINSTAFNIQSYSSNTYIDAYQASFSGILISQSGTILNGGTFLGGALFANSTAGNVGDVFSVGTTGPYWSSSANNALNLNGVPASSYVNTTGSYTISGIHTHTTNSIFTANLYVGNSSVNAIVFANSTNVYFTGTSYNANNSYNLGGFSADQYAYANVIPTLEKKSDLAADVHNLTANNSDYLGGIAAGNYLTYFGNYNITGIQNHTANVSIYGALLANNSAGTVGQVLASDASGNVFWQTTNGQSISVNDLVITGKLFANNFNGEKGLVLTSNGSGTYWSDVTNVSGGIFDGGNPYSSYINSPRLDAGGVY